jgi:hypothetical protein
MQTNRRSLLAAIGAGPMMLAAPAAMSADAPDAVIERAFERRQIAYAAYNDLPDRGEPLVDGFGPGERELWTIINEAEHVIRTTVATTPRGVMLQLWCAMYHSVSGQEDDAALTRGDFAAVERLDNGLDWNARLMLAALRSLQLMEG